MESDFNRFTDRFRRQLLAVRRKLNGLRTYLKPQSRGFASQRMCPFCGLITPRSKHLCLECGRSLKDLRQPRKRYTRMIATLFWRSMKERNRATLSA